LKWIVFIYKVPPKPTKYRAFLWREIRKYGAIYLQDGVFILPDLDDVHLFVGALSEKVQEFGGQEFTFLSSLFSEEKDQELIRQFNTSREEEYKELLPRIRQLYELIREEEMWEFSEQQLQKLKSNFQKLLRRFQAIQARDYFETGFGKKMNLLFNECRRRIYRG
jgi:hypothetical protein